MEKFTKVKNIGKGNMGACALARNNEDGRYYVIKQVDLAKLNKKERQQSLNEAKVLSSLRHPNIVNYFDSFLARKSDHLCIVMEFADGGDLSNRIKNNHGINFTETQVLDWFIQIVLSLQYVHQRKILHRDVKTQNIFLTQDNVCKLGDFGIARTLNNTYDQASTFVGTPYYLSPELILERPYDHMSDVWAAGVVLYELMALRHPFNANDMKSLMHRILKVQYDPPPTIYSSELRGILTKILVKDPMQRIRLSEILELPVVSKRIRQWIDGGILPSRYVTTLLRGKMLPSHLLAYAMQGAANNAASSSNPGSLPPVAQQQQGVYAPAAGGYPPQPAGNAPSGSYESNAPSPQHAVSSQQPATHYSVAAPVVASRSPDKQLYGGGGGYQYNAAAVPQQQVSPPPPAPVAVRQAPLPPPSLPRKADDDGYNRYQIQRQAPPEPARESHITEQGLYRKPSLPNQQHNANDDYYVYRSAGPPPVTGPRHELPPPNAIRPVAGLPPLSSAVGAPVSHSGLYRAYQAQQEFVAPRSLAPVVVNNNPPQGGGLPPVRPANLNPYGGGGVAAAMYGYNRNSVQHSNQIQQHNNDIQAMLQRAAYERAQRQKMMR